MRQIKNSQKATKVPSKSAAIKNNLREVKLIHTPLKQTKRHAKQFLIGIVQSKFNESITDALASKNKFNALIALGCVIRGETYHFELVSNESAAGVNRVSLDHDLPIINAVITTENTVQALVRQEEKGRDAARAAVEMSHLLGIDL